MFQSEELNNHLKTSDTIKIESAVYAEWNMNQPGNVAKLGNYRYRPTYSSSQYFLIPMSYDPLDIGNYYTGATDSDIVVDSGFDDQDQPTLLVAPKEKMKTLYSLEDCIKPHRPRSGINKPLYLGLVGKPLYSDVVLDEYSSAQYITNPSPIDKVTQTQIDNQGYIVNRPRYYPSHKDDPFKYWTSYRSEYGMPTPRPGAVETQVLRQVDRGISFLQSNRYYIEDAAPFVVYKEQVPTNKIVVKMQTNVGDIDLGNMRYGNQSIEDPLYGEANKTTPVIWRIEKLNSDNSWETLIQFDESSTRADGTPIIGKDGYAEISYGLQVPEEYASIFVFADIIPNESLLPDAAPVGYAYLVKENDHDRGTMHIFVTPTETSSFVPDYSWSISDETINYNSKFVTKISDPDYFTDINGVPQFREFEWINGIRLVVETMNKNSCTFDLIEFSPRLTVNMSEKVLGFSVTKTMSDLGNSSVPVGSILASNGQLQIFDEDFSFNDNNIFDFDTNTGSILAGYLNMSIKFLLYDITKDVNGIDYFIPIKTMYTDSFPQTNGTAASISINIRDLFFFLESMPAPEMMLTNVSLSWAITTLLDNIGFSNYTFRRVQGYPEFNIPYFFVEPNQNVATVLQKLAIASQSSIFFDEYNNLVVMSKEYLLPSSEEERQTDTTLYGQVEGENLPNIVSLSSNEKKVFNDGEINYTTRYIQRSIGSTKTAQMLDEYKEYIYKPVLLWEVPGRESTKSINELGSQNSGYTLGAVPLNTDLTDEAPYVDTNIIYNNIIDVGENAYWLPSYSGYLYANGEVIRFDAVEYTVSGQASPIWITNNQQYQDLFAGLKFNGKMYPTGRIRIYTKPEYEIIDGIVNLKNGQIKEHGRGQFGTDITYHSAGLINDDYWTNNDNIRGCIMESSKYLFNTSSYIDYPQSLNPGTAGKIQPSPYVDADSLSRSSVRTGVIKNFLAEKYSTEEEITYYKTTGPGTIQSSALVFTGPKFSQGNESSIPPSSFISYVYKDFIDQNGEAIPYTHFGTRMRVVGKIETGTGNSQTPIGGYPIFEGSSSDNESGSGASNAASSDSPSDPIKIYGGSGGIGISVNKETNNGYFYEIVALTTGSVDNYLSSNNPTYVSANILASPAPSCVNNEVTVYTKDTINFEVGQSVIITGLVDTADPTNTRTPLNGEYEITAINKDKKSFKYKISSSPSLSTTSQTGGTAQRTISEQANIANIYFYKIMSDNKQQKFNAYSVSSNVLTLYFELTPRFKVGEKIVVESTTFAGEYTVKEIKNNTISFDYASSNVAKTSVAGLCYLEEPLAVPYKLWSGLGKINIDSGDFVGQNRLAGQSDVSVYDLAAEYVNIGTTRRFFLYLNGRQVATVDDTDPLPEYNNLALFVRGSSSCMFENVYALANNYSQNSTFVVDTGLAQVFGDNEIIASEALRKYAISGLIQKTYLSGISSLEGPKYKMYFEEFGTILREMAYFNIKYDRAYPALSAKLMKTMNLFQGYAVSGFYAGAYGADFLIFNCTDFNLNLDDTSGNYLRIQGITFTQNTTYTLTVDDYFKKKSILLDTEIGQPETLFSPFRVLEEYNGIKNSRIKYGVNKIPTIESPYIQTTDVAENIFGWIINKVSVPKKVVGLNTFGTSNLQLGDIVTIDYKDAQGEGVDIISPDTTRFVVYNMEYSKDGGGLSTTIYLVEV